MKIKIKWDILIDICMSGCDFKILIYHNRKVFYSIDGPSKLTCFLMLNIIKR